MKTLEITLALALTSVVACTNATDGQPTTTDDQKQDQVENEHTGATSEALAPSESPHPCSWAEMDTAQSACNQKNGYDTRSWSYTCNIVACNATSTTIYYSYNLE